MCLALGGSGWRVTHLDWARRRAWVEPAEHPGKSRWLGSGPPLRFALAEAMARVLREGLSDRLLSARARESLAELCAEFDWVSEEATTVIIDGARGQSRWWTFAGDQYNGAIAQYLRAQQLQCAADGLSVTISIASAAPGSAEALLNALSTAQDAIARDGIDASADGDIQTLKFRECVPGDQLQRMTRARLGPGEEALAMRWRRPRARLLT